MSYLDRNEILILRVLMNIRLCINMINCTSTKNLCMNKCDMVMHQTPRLISVHLSYYFCRAASRLGSLLFSIITYFSHTTKTVTSWADAQTAQIISFAILLLFKLWQLCKNCKRHANIMLKIPINE